jgi:hypothetical protein
MVAGIIVCAAADEKVLAEPGAAASTASAWMILGACTAALVIAVAVSDRLPWLPRHRP